MRATAARLASFLCCVLLLVACQEAGGRGDADVRTGRWGGVINAGGEPVRGGTLRLDQATAPAGVSPLHLTSNPSNQTGQIVQQTFDQLVEYRPGSLEPAPGLAKSWDVSPDGRTYTFELRDASFSNGMPVTAADVEYSLDHARRPDSFYVNMYEAITRIETPNESTVVVRLSEPVPAFLDYIAFVAASIVPAEVVRSQGVDAFDEHPVGSGPFMLKSWVRDQRVELVRNPRHWRKGRPYLDAVSLTATTNDNTRVLDLRSGNLDVADYIPYSQVRAVDEADGASTLVAPRGDMEVIWVNNSVKPLDEVNVRRALNYATPVDSIIDVVFKGHTPRMNTILPKAKYWTSEAKPYRHDLGKAKEALAASSVPRGFEATVTLDGADQASRQIAEIVQQVWAKIGVRLRIETVDTTALGNAYQTGKYELALFRPGEFTSDIPADDQFAKLLFDSPETHNLFTWYENPALAKLVRQANRELDEQERTRLYARIHAESMRNPPVIPLAYTPSRFAVRDSVHGFNCRWGGLFRLDTVWLEKR